MAGVIPKSEKRAIRRIMRDVKGVKELEDMGIYVYYDPDKTFNAKALIIGPSDTPYEKGYFLFNIKFPKNYPFSSPDVKFMTGDGKTRFHPNLYVKGKVCLSILGTWSGPSWTSSQNLSSVLASIQSLMDDQPLRNEPGFENEKGARSKTFSRIVQHQVYAVSVLNQLNKCPTGFENLYPHMKKHFVENFNWYLCLLNTLSDKPIPGGKKSEKSVYGGDRIKYNYRGILNGLLQVYNDLTESSDEIILTEETIKTITSSVSI